MKQKMLNNIKLLEGKIGEYQNALKEALTRNEGYDTLKGMRAQIRICRDELNKLELAFGNESQEKLF